MSYISNTPDDQKKMLAKIGVEKLEDLFEPIPEGLRLKRPLDIQALSEIELLAELEEFSKRNDENLTCFAGGGVYDHFIPAALEVVLSRPEFMTAYTPYQPEVSQGTLQIIYEFQTHICRLTGMEVANASMYDGASASAEALILAMNVTKRRKVVISETVNPLWREVIKTYLSGRDVDMVIVPHQEGLTDFSVLSDYIDEQTAAVLVSQPNFFGNLEDIEQAVQIMHAVGGKVVLGIDPIAQALLKTPAEYNADIVVGEGQPLGIPMSFGGPLVGFFAAKKELIRFMPGRIVARTKDVDGKEGFVLTLQTREQHIRREKATSNICTNQALMATAATIYCSLLGKQGLKKAALLSAEKAHDAYKQICNIDGFEPYFKEQSFVREFAIKTPYKANDILDKMIERGVLAGIYAGRWYSDLDDCLIIAATEKRTDADIEKLITNLKELAASGVLSSL
ncbi:MAG: aminomethyl-transferring glycine dehydrogenase subunit GcvPA [Calditrichaeota bacterium]|nr:MAG: aminomethyl-transferring glycine dehydrogenase subunit GcvPA [Calditrichota bacterium]